MILWSCLYLKGEEKCLEWDDRKARICWRSDGEFFVFSFLDSSSKTRKFQVFTREGVLHSTVEKDIHVLDSTIAWKYSKSLIAGSIYRLNKHEIIFFISSYLIDPIKVMVIL